MSESEADDGSEGADGTDGADASAAAGSAERVVVSYPADLSGWGRHQLDTRHFRAWLRDVLGAAEAGETVEAFVGVGCCGDTLDVPLRVERLAGGDRVGEGTTVEYEVREGCDVAGGWAVQSAAGPDSG